MARRSLTMWWREGWHEGSALAVAVGMHTLAQGLLTLYAPTLILFLYGFTPPLSNLIFEPTIVGIVGVYLGVVLIFCPASWQRYAAFVAAFFMWGYVLWVFASSSLYPLIVLGPPSATIALVTLGLVRARAWVKHDRAA